MKLIYLWVEAYGCFQNQGFKLASDYQVDFDVEQNVLSIQKKEGDIGPLLYGKNLDITAIVGDNGAGKSTLLDLIRLFLFNKNELSGDNIGFLVFANGLEVVCYNYTKRKIRKLWHFSGVDSMPFDVVAGNRYPHYSELIPDLIYYSEFLDFKYYDKEFDDGEDKPYVDEEMPYYDEDMYDFDEESSDMYYRGYMDKRPTYVPGERGWSQYDISQSGLLRKISKESDVVRTFFHEDMKRQINFFNTLRHTEDFEKYIPFQMPQVLNIKIGILDMKRFNEVLDDSLRSYEYLGMGHHGENNTNSFTIGLLKKLETIHEKLFNQLNNVIIKHDHLIKWNLCVTFLYNLLLERKEDGFSERDDYDDLDELLRALWDNQLPEINTILKKLDDMFKPQEDVLETYQTFIAKLENFKRNATEGIIIKTMWPRSIQSLYQGLPKEAKEIENIGELLFAKKPRDLDTYEEPLKEFLGWNGVKEMEHFLSLFESYIQLAHHMDFLNFDWGLSSGEYHLFSLYARLWEAMEKTQSRTRSGVIVAIDELDSTYHPKWQQLIVEALQIFFTALYPEKTIQMIITTHSPVLLSDIPEEKVIFVRKGGMFQSGIEKQHRQTFAANIATLYYDSFFMEHGSIGSLSKKHINALYSALCETEKNQVNADLKERFFIRKYMGNLQSITGLDGQLLDQQVSLNQIRRLIDSVGEDLWRYKLHSKFNTCFGEADAFQNDRELSAYVKKLREEKGEAAVTAMIKEIKGRHRDDKN